VKSILALGDYLAFSCSVTVSTRTTARLTNEPFGRLAKLPKLEATIPTNGGHWLTIHLEPDSMFASLIGDLASTYLVTSATISATSSPNFPTNPPSRSQCLARTLQSNRVTHQSSSTNVGATAQDCCAPRVRRLSIGTRGPTLLSSRVAAFRLRIVRRCVEGHAQMQRLGSSTWNRSDAQSGGEAVVTHGPASDRYRNGATFRYAPYPAAPSVGPTHVVPNHRPASITGSHRATFRARPHLIRTSVGHDDGVGDAVMQRLLTPRE